MRVFGIDPGSERTGYGCIDSDGSRHRLVVCGAIATRSCATFPDKLLCIHRELAALVARHAPDVVAVESVFHAANVRSALKLGHARGVAMLAAVARGVPVAEYAPAAVKRAVVGYGRAEKHQVQEMIRVLLGLDEVPQPNDAADALAVAICHLHSMVPGGAQGLKPLGLQDYAHARGQSVAGPGAADSVAGRAAVDSVVGPGASAPGRAAVPKHLRSWRQYRPPGEIR